MDAGGRAPDTDGVGARHARRSTVARLPRLVVGPGRIAEVPAIVADVRAQRAPGDGRPILPGRACLGRVLVALLDEAGLGWEHLAVAGEPSPGLVDAAVAARRADPPDVVVGIGGGSALDAAKAIAGLLRSGTAVLDHLEGVGRGIPYLGPATPFIAAPTTAGTGSEVTKNAVLSGRLPNAAPGTPPFKKSFRDERLVAQAVVLDPDLLASCPPAVVAGDGMDAVTQLLEAFTSTGASPFTDAVARTGLEAAVVALPAWHAATVAGAPPESSAAARAAMSWAACCSGIALASAGLGAVHGIVAPLGAAFPVHHGIGVRDAARGDDAGEHRGACGTGSRLAGAGPLRRRRSDPGRRPRADRRAGARRPAGNTGRLDEGPADAAAGGLRGDAEGLPGLVAESRGSSMRTNPIVLADEEIAGILTATL